MGCGDRVAGEARSYRDGAPRTRPGETPGGARIAKPSPPIDFSYEMTPAFMKERTQEYMSSAKTPGLVKATP